MELTDLKKQIPYQWRVQSYSKYKAEAMCVAYIDARDVMELLDEVVGGENWQSDYKDIGGQMFAGIAIRSDLSWVWKWDTGSESKVEAEKGQASDSFKRAAVKWGIGRFLYDLPVKKVKTNGALSDSHKYPEVVDEAGKRVWDLSKHINASEAPKPALEAPQSVQKPKEDVGITAAKALIRKHLTALGHKAGTVAEVAAGVSFETDIDISEIKDLASWEGLAQQLLEKVEKKK